MSIAGTGFYVTGGTLPPGAPSYVPRRADNDLYQGLLRGEFCYVLTSRQMGKSSLMAHTTLRLREAGLTVVNLDLARLGQNLTVEQWYDGLLSHLGRQLHLEDELEAYWLEHEQLSPLQRWLGALWSVALGPGVQPFRRSGVLEEPTVPPERLKARTPECPRRLVIAIDEIDTVRSLPFSTGEFFAAIRDCYNRRAHEPEFQRLTFCLLGEATPSDLIQGTRTTPFNIGRRIELTDFAPAEAAPLASGLGREQRLAAALLNRVLHWTGGHPYLTQRLCHAVAEDASVRDPAGVDRWCGALFLSHRARERDDNLLFVRDRLLRGEADVAGILSLYARVRSARQPVPDDETSPLVSRLRLSGIAREREGFLRVRNRIYARVFNRAWIEANMPDAELRRLRALARDEARKRRQAEERERELRRSLYVADMNLAQQAWDIGHVERVLELLEAHRPGPGQEERRGFEWRYLWRACQEGSALFTWSGHPAAVVRVAFSPDGGTLAAGCADGTITLWDTAAKQEVGSLEGHRPELSFVGFSPDGTALITAGPDGVVTEWALSTRREIARWQGSPCRPRKAIALSPDGTVLAMGTGHETVDLYDTARKRPAGQLTGHTRNVLAIAFSPDGQLLATGSGDETFRLWDLAAKRQLAVLGGFTGAGEAAAFSPDGEILATGGFDGAIRLWETSSGRLVAVLTGHKRWDQSLAFSPVRHCRMGSWVLASVSDTVKLWDVEGRRLIHTLRGHRGHVYAVSISPDGAIVATGGEDRTVRFWDAAGRPKRGVLHGHQDQVWHLAFSPDGRTLATGSYDATVRLWDVASERELALLRGHGRPVACVAFSPDGGALATGTGAWNTPEEPGEVKLWNVATGQERLSLPRQNSSVQSLAFSPDGTRLATRNAGGAVKLWDVATWEEIDSANCEQSTPYGGLPWTSSVLFSPDGKRLATGYVGDSVRLWDLAGGQETPDLAAGTNGMTSQAFSPDGKLLAVGNDTGAVRLWEIRVRRVTALLQETGGLVYSVAFSPDGKRLAAGYHDARVRLWDLATKRQVATLHGHENVVTAVAFSPDGNILASASGDHTVRLWRAATL